jgi:hypothetical protein
MTLSVDYRQALLDEVQELPEESLPALVQIVHLFKESLLQQRRQAVQMLQAEISQWDQLSDEALVEFERGLAP